MKNAIGLYGAIAALSLGFSQAVVADPQALRDDIEIRNVMALQQRTMRIAKDPRDNTIYTLTATGNISRIVIPSTENRAGPAIAQGVLDSDTGERVWTVLDPAGDVPDGVPLEAILAAEDEGLTRFTSPTDGKLYILGADGSVQVPPRTVVVPAEDHGLSHVGALFIDADGTFYLVLDTDAANSSSEERLYTSSDHGFNDTQGFDIGPDGTFYIGVTTRSSGNRITGVVKGVMDAGTGERIWTVIAQTEPIPPGTKNHPHPGVTVDPEGRFVYLNSGSRTDHGEIADRNGSLPGVREVPLSATILRLPTDGEGILIPGDAEGLAASGYLYADGFRNAFDTAFAGNGDLFAGDNGPDSDHPESISWVRQGHHYGFPWRMGGVDTAMRFSDYDPTVDNFILFTRSGARNDGLFYNDPDYPAPPAEFTNPIVNLGPDADRFRDPISGEARDASDEGLTVHTLTPHSSPLGLVFDVDNVLSDEFRGDGFVLRTGGDCCDLINSFNDPDQDLLHLDLEKVGDNYQARITRIVSGFEGPIDAEMVGNKIYVVEWSGGRGLWEIALPEGAATAVEELADDGLPSQTSLAPNYPNPFNPSTTIEYRVEGLGAVELAVFDLLGQKIRTLVNAEQAPGRYAVKWDGRTENGLQVSSGVYLYRLTAGSYRETRRLTLLK
jgi:hypothetical protein